MSITSHVRVKCLLSVSPYPLSLVISYPLSLIPCYQLSLITCQLSIVFFCSPSLYSLVVEHASCLAYYCKTGSLYYFKACIFQGYFLGSWIYIERERERGLRPDQNKPQEEETYCHHIIDVFTCQL